MLKIRDFTDLVVWKQAHELVLEVYKITKKFPKEELFCLTSQIRRCSVSITSNIAEGFGRVSYKEKGQFYFVAQGSVLELLNQLIISKDVGYISQNDFDSIYDKISLVRKIFSGLIKRTKDFIK